MNKTERYFDLVFAIANHPQHEIADEEFRRILEHPSKSQYHKHIAELAQVVGHRTPLLSRYKKDKNFFYSLHPETWKEFFKHHKVVPANPMHARVRIHGDGRNIFKNYIHEHNLKDFYLLHSFGPDHDEYDCLYSDPAALVKDLYVHAEYTEILSPQEIKDAFIEKARHCLFLNAAGHAQADKKDVA